MNHESPRPRRSREEIAQSEIGHTEITRGMTGFLIGTFLLTLVTPPIAQFVYDLLPSRQKVFDGQPQEQSAFPSSLQLLQTLPSVMDTFRATSGGFINKTFAVSQQLVRTFDEYERQLEERSLLNRELTGATRTFLAKFGGIGHDQVEIGRNHWLFFRADIEYLTGPGFLEPQRLRHRARASGSTLAPVQPDPRQAIIEFHQQLASRGIRLIVMPTPGKAALYPEQLSKGGSGTAEDQSASSSPTPPDVSTQAIGSGISIPLQNRSFDVLIAELKTAKVLVFDPAPVLAAVKHTNVNDELFLRTDTHWTPFGMQCVAKQLSDFIENASLLPERPATTYEQRSLDMTNRGDIEMMLRLPANQNLFPPQTITIRQIEQRAGVRWQPDSTSDLLLLGDSYTNIYSMPELKWGTAAGLAEQLSFHLRRPVDRLAQNDGGAFAARQTLFRELARGHDRLANKRLVIWQFTTRDLASGDWKLQPMPAVPQNSVPQNTVPAQDQPSVTSEMVVRGTVRATASAPRLGTVPYRDALTGIHLADVTRQDGTPIASELVVYLWGLRDNQLTPAARFVAGQQITLKLVLWDHVKSRYERFNRLELDDPDFHLAELPIYWGEPIERGERIDRSDEAK